MTNSLAHGDRTPLTLVSAISQFIHEFVDFALGPLTGIAILLLEQSDQLIPLSLDTVELVVGQFASLFFRFSLELLPLAF